MQIFDKFSELTTTKVSMGHCQQRTICHLVLIHSVSQTAAILDFFPLLRRLPDFLLPVIREGREIHRRELNLFQDHYLTTKQRLKDGTAKVAHTQHVHMKL